MIYVDKRTGAVLVTEQELRYVHELEGYVLDEEYNENMLDDELSDISIYEEVK